MTDPFDMTQRILIVTVKIWLPSQQAINYNKRTHDVSRPQYSRSPASSQTYHT